MFIRTKKIYGKQYAYKVQSEWTKYGPRQKNLSYLGKIVKPERKDDKDFQEFLHNTNYEEYLQNSDYKQIIKDLIELELLNHGFEETSNEYFRFQDVYVNLEIGKVVAMTSKQNEKAACIKLNQGVLCNDTIKELMGFQLSENEEMNIYTLANAFVGAGISIPKEVFIKVYEKKLMGN